MYLKSTSFFNLRNLENSSLNYSKDINFFYGKNGQGKTSLLEGIYFNLTGKSFRTKSAKEIIKYSSHDFGVYSEYSDSVSEKSIAAALKNGKKSYFFNKKKINFDEFIGKCSVISFIPEDIDIISGTPGTRREFFDYEISQSNYDYYISITEFEKVLKTRNKMLSEKNSKNDIFEIYNLKYMELAAKIILKRAEYVKNISILLNLNYRKLFDRECELKIVYSSFLGEIGKSGEEEILNSIKEEAKKHREREIYSGFSMFGPQKDDFIFMLREKDAKHYSSQGEKRSIVFSLKVAEIDMILKEKKENPIFLIDDISAYFDRERQLSVINYFKKRNIQTFITSTEELEIGNRLFFVEKGEIK